ncbi:hypothetical protein ABFS82_14G048600 [Erythranthe guttata]|uniref:nuclear pore complex protein NUP214 n=1 Tax=Erythranthe guttata TaxID=4155 RepID=UPI00064D8CF5|nr:PREDICTED: nuclear pore complex protein NUP214 [Erythranthe guttata]|eukprot:XP_012843051.1 PREDICTED: nuclear pore complex protein NUP214 [Erythranthe guttata]
MATDGVAIVDLDEEIEGDYVGTKNYQFSKIGESVPIKSDGTSEFDPQCVPSQPLAVSERFRLLFVAHSQGFCVVRTKDVMASAEEIKEKKTGPSVQELSFVDVPIGEVSILALSSDDSLLAVGIASQVHFFAVSALLHKDQKPSFSVSLDDSIGIKDVRWARKLAKDYVILSSSGKLYHGSGQGPLVCVMEEVDSVDWSVKGNFVAVAKKNNVSIFSSQFEEQLRFSLSFKSVIGDSDVNEVIKVDSIRWIRQDCIAVGCIQLNDDGEEENYIIQVITSRGRSITDAASKPIVLSFSSIFFDFCSDAVPARNGPHLFLSYLNLYGLSFIASRNLSQQVGLLNWSLESGRNEAAAVEILNDAWSLHIDSQANGDENVILGLSVDKVSQNENVRFTLGDEETEVSPCCIVICLTIDGKVSVFHFASATGALESPEGCASDEEENASQVSVKHELSQISSTVGEKSRDPTFSASESHEPGKVEVEKTGAKATVTNNLSPFHVDMRSQGHTATGNWGHKPLVESQTVKGDEPEKALLAVPNQDINAGNQSARTGLFSGKVVGDISNQVRSNPLLSSSNVEQLGKAPPASSPSMWSSAGSNARVDASKTSDGKSLSLFSGKVDNSDKIPLQYARVALRDPADLKEKARPSTTFISSGQTTSTSQGNKNLLSAYPGLQVPPMESVVSGKSFMSEFKKELNAASTPTGLPYSVQNSSKQFGNVEEMAKKLDNLLEGIVGKGGFREASITSQANSVKELEDGIWALSDRCRVWKGLVNEQSREVQLLLDKTVQVLVRKVYVEGIFKQATDSRYWELWNRQKLSSELELKRRRILELNQELTNKLIELERHFNSLEFNKFGENEGAQRNRKLLQNRQGHSRQIQSLHSLHNTMHAQLAAAEQLSGCLSKQMAALSIESSGKQDIKKQLFDSIGLSYADDSKKSPARNRDFDTPATKGHLITSGSVAAQTRSRNQPSFAKSVEPETARRRRESLDHSWASFDPPKTTVKRMLKEDHEKGSADRSSLNIDKHYFSPQSQKKPEVARSALLNISRALLNGSKGTAELPSEQFHTSPLTSSYQRTGGFLDHGVQVSSTKTISALPQPSLFEKRVAQSTETGAFKLIDEKSKSNSPFTGRNSSFASNESKFIQQSDTKIPSITKQLPGQSLTSPFDSSQSPVFTKSATWDQKNTRTVSETPRFDFKIPVDPPSAFSSGPNVSEKGLFAESSEKPGQPNDGRSASAPLQTAFSSSSFVSKPISSTLLPAFPVSSGASAAAKLEVSQPRTSVPSTPSFTFTPPSSSREKDTKTDGISERQTSVVNTPSKTENNTKLQDSTSDLKLATLSSSAFSGLSTTKSIGGFDFGSSSKSSSVVQTELTSATESHSPVAPSSEGNVSIAKNVISDSSHEEEMEEEAPETDSTAGFTLGNLGGFGLGSTPNSNTPKSNPFGVSVLSKDTTFAPSPYTTSPSSGELFRPASFNFQLPQSSESLQPTSAVNFPGGFSSGVPGQVSAGSVFGQPSNIGAGQQALGSVLGSFGQSRQIGAGLPGNNAAPASGFGSGFTGVSAGGFGGGFNNTAAAPSGGFGGGFNAAAAAPGGGFASLAAGGGGFASAGGGFAAAATAGGGFAAAATAGGGFGAAATAGGGFAAATTAGGGFAAAGAVSGGGFGGFGNQQSSGGGFSAFGGGSGAARPPSELFTQMRK